jgi:2-polyprenyl-3-methyl-5-hydroxy-6-metoxy-1,4-benzoquinol methylase
MIMPYTNDEVWEELAKKNPYWAVISMPEYRADVLNPEVRDKFFQTGRDFVDHLYDRAAGMGCSPDTYRTVIDFGCGVGRLSRAFAERDTTRRITAIDISQEMLDLCANNCRAYNSKMQYMRCTDSLPSLADGTYDLCASTIVFQHIPQKRGLNLFSRLFRTLRPGGLMAHFFIFSPFHRVGETGIGEGAEQQIQMNEYDMNEVLTICQFYGSQVYLELMQHGAHVGTNVYAIKD